MKNYSKEKLGFHVEDFIEHNYEEFGLERVLKKLDIENGTDFKLNGLPVDITTNFTGKDHMEDLKKPLWIDHSLGLFVEFGIRTGNNHHGFTPFEIPVLVIGIHYPSSEWIDDALRKLKKNFDEVKEAGQDLYWDWLDCHPEYDL